MTAKSKPIGLKFFKVSTIDHRKTGEAAKEHRKTLKLDQSLIADRMGISPAFLSMLESGNRTWTPQLMQDFNAACEKGVQQ